MGSGSEMREILKELFKAIGATREALSEIGRDAEPG